MAWVRAQCPILGVGVTMWGLETCDTGHLVTGFMGTRSILSRGHLSRGYFRPLANIISIPSICSKGLWCCWQRCESFREDTPTLLCRLKKGLNPLIALLFRLWHGKQKQPFPPIFPYKQTPAAVLYIVTGYWCDKWSSSIIRIRTEKWGEVCSMWQQRTQLARNIGTPPLMWLRIWRICDGGSEAGTRKRWPVIMSKYHYGH